MLLTEGLIVLLSGICFLSLSVGGSDVFPPPLSKEEERRCFLSAGQGDEKAREKLIRHNMRLVAHIIKKYYSTGKDQEDLVSIGTIGLIKAIDSFDPAKGARFATYAGKCLQNEILMYFRSQKKTNGETSLNDAIELDKDGNPLTYLDVISHEDDVVEALDRKTRARRAMCGIRECLTPREQNIILYRYGILGKRCMTQREMAKAMGISRSYVSRLEKGALDKLKQYMGEEENTTGGNSPRSS